MGFINSICKEIGRVFDRNALDTLVFFVTNKCNMNCPFCCYSKKLNQAEDMTFDEIKRLVVTIGPFRSLLVSGGEPFLRRDLEDILDLICTHCYVESISIPTNGSFPKRIVRFVESFTSKHPETAITVQISIDGPAEEHDQVRGFDGAFERAFKTLKTLAALRGTNSSLRLRLDTILHERNVEGFWEFCQSIREAIPLDEYCIDYARDRSLEDTDYEAKKPLMNTYTQVAETCYEKGYFESSSKGLRRSHTFGLPLSRIYGYGSDIITSRLKTRVIQGKLWPFPCTAGRTIAVITADGNLKVCELRNEELALSEHNFNFQKARYSIPFQETIQAVARERCDCIHGCFIGNSFRHSGNYFLLMCPLAYFERSMRRFVRSR